ncbi:MAG: sel1 repeat family protein [Lysobacteraceae bacterium]|nr:MAG: sel1 repeat family protein [Xanthomonadaceae bacterium]
MKRYTFHATLIILGVMSFPYHQLFGQRNLLVESSCDEACLKDKALLGDGSAAYRLGNSYMYTDRDAMSFWYQISAENGEKLGQYSYAHFLAAYSTESKDCLRAIYWFKRASTQGHAESKKASRLLLNGLKKNSGYKSGCAKQYMEGL